MRRCKVFYYLEVETEVVSCIRFLVVFLCVVFVSKLHGSFSTSTNNAETPIQLKLNIQTYD